MISSQPAPAWCRGRRVWRDDQRGDGGPIGLGGAEFRLPLLVGFFRYGLRPAIRLNLLMSLVTVTVAGLALGRVHEVVDLVRVALPLLAGGMAGAYLASPWLTGITESQLGTAIRTLLLAIGALLVAEAALPWESTGLPLDLAGGSWWGWPPAR